MKSATIAFALPQNSQPAQAGLSAFKDKKFKQCTVVEHRTAPFIVVIINVQCIGSTPATTAVDQIIHMSRHKIMEYLNDNGLESNTVQGLSFLVSSVILFYTFFSPSLLILEEQVWGFAISD